MVKGNLTGCFFAKTLYKGFSGHVDPTPYLRDFFPSAGRAVPKVLPMDVIHRGALVLDFLGLLVRFAFARLNVLGDLKPVVTKALWRNVRLVAHPCYATATQEAVGDALLHGCPEVGVVLNFKVYRPFNEQAGNAADLIVVTKPA